DTSPSLSKTISASPSDGVFTMSNTSGLTCDGTLAFVAYSSQTFSAEFDNGTRVCYKAVDTATNTTYSLSNAITGIDTSAPMISMIEPDTSPSLSKTISASPSDGVFTMSNTSGLTCDGTLAFVAYSSQTFSVESDNGTRVCYKAVDAATNTTYSLSNAITGIDTSAPTILMIEPDANPALNKTISASPSDGALTMSNTSGLTCDGTLAFVAYSSQIFSAESENGTRVCYKAVDTATNTTYSLSNAITGIDTTAPTISMIEPDANPALSKTISASPSDGAFTMSNTSGLTCGGTLAFVEYSSQTFSAESDNGTRVCYKAVDTATNTTYSFSSAIAGIDTTAPTISFSPPSVSSTSAGPVDYTVTFTDANFNASTLTVDNIILNKTDTADGIISSVTGSGNTRTVTISEITGNGTLGISIAAGAADDLAGNSALAAGPSTTIVVENTLLVPFQSRALFATLPLCTITSFTFTGISAGTISGTNITVSAPFGTVNPLTASFFTGPLTATVTVGTTDLNQVVQVSDTTSNDFFGKVLQYKVSDATCITQTYSVTVTVAKNTAKLITSFSFTGLSLLTTITEAASKIEVIVPIGADITALTPAIVLSTNATVSPLTEADFSSPVVYTVTAENGNTRIYTVTVKEAGADIISFSFASVPLARTVITGTNIAVTVPYLTTLTALTPTITLSSGATVSPLSGVAKDFRSTVSYTVTPAGSGSPQTYAVTVTAELNSAKAIKAFSFANLSIGTTIDEAAKTIVVTVPYGTNVIGLKPTIVLSIQASVSPLASVAQDFRTGKTYTVTARDGISTQPYTVTVVEGANPADRAISAFSFMGSAFVGAITGTNIAVTVPFETDVTKLVANFTASSGASVEIKGWPQVSGTTINDFTSPVTYKVTSADKKAFQDYIVTVTIRLNPAKSITNFRFLNQPDKGVITGSTPLDIASIAISVPFGTNKNGLIATFITTGASVKVGTKTQVNGETPNDFTNPVTYTVVSATGITKTYRVTVTVDPNPTKDITAFSIPGQAATGVFNGTYIAVTVPYRTNLRALIANFTATSSVVKVGSVVQISGTTKNNFSIPVVYTVVAADRSEKTYRVKVTVAPKIIKYITAFSFTNPAATGVITEPKRTIAVTVPFGTDVSALVASFKDNDASPMIGGTPQISGETPNNFAVPVSYKLSDSKIYKVTVKVAASPAKDISSFSFSKQNAIGVISGTNIEVTVPFGTKVNPLVANFTTTGISVKIGTAKQVSGVTRNNFTNPVLYRVTAADASTKTYTVTIKVAPKTAKDITAFSFGSPSATGVISGTNIAVSVPFGTNVNALIANFTTTGASVKVAENAQISGTTANNFTNPVIYRVTAIDTSMQDYTVTVTVAINPANKDITAFSFGNPSATGVISGATIAVTVPFGTNVNALVASFTTTGSSVKIGASAVQTSGTTANNFTSPLTYIVNAADASTKSYIVTVTAAPNPAKDITAFSFTSPAATGVISGTSIAVTVPFGTNVNALIASFTTTGSSVKIDANVQTSGTTPNNFTSPLTYRVTAADASMKDYIVTVTVAINPANKDITAFSFGIPSATGAISGTSIAVTVPFGTNVNALIASFTTTGSSVKNGASVVQTSGTTPNNFTSPLTYIVTAADASTKSYIVTVTVSANPAKDITTFSFTSPAATGVITGTSIVLMVPFGTNPFGLVANFTTTGGSVKVGSMSQTSGTTANNFASPVVYTVTAADASTQDYTVTVIVAAK
ncbi:MAG: DUF5018 domain-containing protein, partial [Chloroflexi bacterium]|nr:DUF5018 domain-containing protein [Chloroflexota bacterium]